MAPGSHWMTANERLSDIGVHDFDLAWLGCHETVQHSVLRKRSPAEQLEEEPAQAWVESNSVRHGRRCCKCDEGAADEPG
jgi:hypothetical protein